MIWIAFAAAIITASAMSFVIGRASVILPARRKAQIEAAQKQAYITGQITRTAPNLNPPTFRPNYDERSTS